MGQGDLNEGIVIERRGRVSLLAGLRTIGQGIAVYVERHLLQIIRDHVS
jgi:hypothetical protein